MGHIIDDLEREIAARRADGVTIAGVVLNESAFAEFEQAWEQRYGRRPDDQPAQVAGVPVNLDNGWLGDRVVDEDVEAVAFRVSGDSMEPR